MPLPGTDTGSIPGFLSTTLRLCAGTEILTDIYRSSPVRALWRFFLLTILCAVMAAVVATLVQRSSFERAGRGLDEEIGAFAVTPQKIYVEKAPETPRRLKLPYIMLEYFPGSTLSRDTFNTDRFSDLGLVILPGGLASWSRVQWKGEDIFSATLMPAAGLYAAITSEKMNDKDAPVWGMFSGPGLAETLENRFGSSAGDAESAKDAGADAPPTALRTGTQIVPFAMFVLTAVTFLNTLGRNFLQIGLIILLVSLVQYLRASTLPKGIAYRNVLTVMIYSTFPAQIAATLFDAAGGGRYLSFQIVFVAIFFIYQIFALRAVIRKVCPQLDRKDDDFDDSDF